MQPQRRDLDFQLTTQVRPVEMGNWHAQGRPISHFFNALSLFFPEGERFFIHSIRHYRPAITDPALQRDIAGFIGQEAMHGREHVDYNRLMEQAGLPADRLQSVVARLLDWIKAWLPASFQLAVTLALEHFTAMLAHVVLTRPRILEGCHPRLVALWRWHALEETEHKGVAFDVYRQAVGTGLLAWLMRCSALVLASIVFMTMVCAFNLRLVRADRQARGLIPWLRQINFLFAVPGALRLLILPWLDYFRPNFHPWDHDNRKLLDQIGPLTAQYPASR